MGHVAVNIVTWNSAAYIQNCLEHLAQQAYTDFSITIIDNASQDDTLQRIQTWDALPITLIRNATNRGFAPAHNQGIAHTQSDYVLVLNPDVVLLPGFLTHMVAALQSDPTLGSASGKLIQLEPAHYHAGEFPPTLQPHHLIDGAGLHMTRSRRQKLNGHQLPALEHFTQPQPIFGPDGAAPLYRRAMLEDIALHGHYFDELFVTHKEDVDLAWRAQLYGWGSIFTPQALAYHIRTFRPYNRREGTRTRRHIDPTTRINAVKNRWLMILKNDHPALFLRHLPYILSYDLAVLAYLLLFEQRSLQAIPRTLALLPQALKNRRLTQSKRRRPPRQMKDFFI